jgi:Fe2+ or Zn2+ uptake regulation protein
MYSNLQIEAVIEAFRESGRRWTPQRQAVLEALLRMRHHPTAEEIYASVRKRVPGMSRATVYNTMEALAGMGRITSVTAPDGTRRYETNQEPHHHLRCRLCGSIVDLAANSASSSPPPAANRLRGFHVESVRVEYHGICAACAQSGGRTKTRGRRAASVAGRQPLRVSKAGGRSTMSGNDTKKTRNESR